MMWEIRGLKGSRKRTELNEDGRGVEEGTLYSMVKVLRLTV